MTQARMVRYETMSDYRPRNLIIHTAKLLKQSPAHLYLTLIIQNNSQARYQEFPQVHWLPVFNICMDVAILV